MPSGTLPWLANSRSKPSRIYLCTINNRFGFNLLIVRWAVNERASEDVIGSVLPLHHSSGRDGGRSGSWSRGRGGCLWRP